MIPTSTEELTELLEKATPGKWRLDETRAGELALRVFGTTVSGFTAFMRPGSWTHKSQQIEVAANAALIVAAVNALPGLLADNERSDRAGNTARQALLMSSLEVIDLKERAEAAEAEVEQLKVELEQWRSDNPPDYAGLRKAEARANTAEASLKVMAEVLGNIVSLTYSELGFINIRSVANFAIASLNQPAEAKLSALGGGLDAEHVRRAVYDACESYESVTYASERGGVIDRFTTRILALSTPANPWRPTHKHVKRGTEYRVLGVAEFQNAMDADMPEGVHIVFYQAVDGKLWAREHREFDDGRFMPLPTPEEDR